MRLESAAMLSLRRYVFVDTLQGDGFNLRRQFLLLFQCFHALAVIGPRPLAQGIEDQICIRHSSTLFPRGFL